MIMKKVLKILLKNMNDLFFRQLERSKNTYKESKLNAQMLNEIRSEIKNEIQEIKNELKTEIEEIKNEFKREIEEIKRKMEYYNEIEMKNDEEQMKDIKELLKMNTKVFKSLEEIRKENDKRKK